MQKAVIGIDPTTAIENRWYGIRCDNQEENTCSEFSCIFPHEDGNAESVVVRVAEVAPPEIRDYLVELAAMKTVTQSWFRCRELSDRWSETFYELP